MHKILVVKPVIINLKVIKLLLCSDTGGPIFDEETYLHIDGPMYSL